jgi:hypothetical protein
MKRYFNEPNSLGKSEAAKELGASKDSKSATKN